MAESDFNELLHAAEQLSAEVDGSQELPKVERSLRQVLEASTELWSRVTQTGAQDLQAHVLLGSKGVDLPQLSQKLESLSTRKTFEPLEPVPEVDVQSYLKNELENAILSIIDETNRTSFESAERRMWEAVRSRWRQEKVKALNALLGSSDEMINITVAPEVSMATDKGNRLHSQMDDLQAAYAGCVAEYNILSVQGALKPSLIERFRHMFMESHDTRAEDLWEMADFMSKIPAVSTGDPLASRFTEKVEQALVAQGRKYLEKRYRAFMASKVESNLAEARRGGEPGTLPLVLAFSKLCQVEAVPGLEDIEVHGQPIWPVVYFCLRAGKANAALAALRQGGPAVEEFRALLEEILHSESEVAGAGTSSGPTAGTITPGTINPNLEQQIDMQYQRSVRHGTDPFKKAVYCSLIPCDVTEDHPLIVRTADDYLWMKLGQVRRSKEHQSIEEVRTYGQLQKQILEEYGEAHYNAKMQPLLYFQMLFLTGQFEAAIEFLSRQERLRTHGIHIALAFNELQLLALPFSFQAPLLSSLEGDEMPSRRLNVARLIKLYVHRFEATDTKEALHYYYLLRNIKNREGQSLFHVCVSELVMEVRNFDAVLGKLQPDGCRTPGLIDIFQGIQADVKQIIDLVAFEAERKGLYEDAVHLYDLAGNHEKVLTLLGTLLSQVAQQVAGPGSVRARLQDLAAVVALRYQGQQITCSVQTSTTFFILCDLLMFFDQYHAGDHQLALEYPCSLQISSFDRSTLSLFTPQRSTVHYASGAGRSGGPFYSCYARDLKAPPEHLAASVARGAETERSACSATDLGAFIVLLESDQFLKLKREETITHLKLVPMSMADMEECVANFRRLSDEVCRCIPDVLLATMNILHALYNWVKSGGPLSETLKDLPKEQQLAYLREKARTLTTFAGTVPYHMPGDTNSRLVQIEILMN